MKSYVLPEFDPEKIRWVFSLSGGKDSYTMCKGIYDWYCVNGYNLIASGIYIWQWGESLHDLLVNTFPWLDEIKCIDARMNTEIELKCIKSRQAPCRKCADIRRMYSDEYLGTLGKELPIFVCRGLHMTDMTISILWRLIWNGPGDHLSGKGRPLVRLMNNWFLAKPLCFVREYESQEYSGANYYKPLSCKCPAHTFPSRRDIIEESARLIYNGHLWEFDVPGLNYYLSDIAPFSSIKEIKQLSLLGVENKTPCIPFGYYLFAKDYFLKQYPFRGISYSAPILIDSLANDLFFHGRFYDSPTVNWSCKLLSTPDELSDFDIRMIGTLGPLWGSIAFPLDKRKQFFALQMQLWNYLPDVLWSQVCDLIDLYYSTM